MIQRASQTFEENKILQEKKEIKEKIEKQQFEEELERKPNKNYDAASPSVKRIEELGFTILSYYEDEHPYDTDYYGKMDVYLCEYKDWKFKVEWFADPDIDEGILALREPKNKITGEKLDFYCDLFCKNTGERLLNNFLTVFDIGLEKFIQQEYHQYLALPSLLREKGYRVTEHDFQFDLRECKGAIEVGEGIFIRIYEGKNQRSKMTFTVTNDQRWSAGSFALPINNKKAYFFDYKGKEDIDELCLCIDSFQRHMKGTYGFKETRLTTEGETVAVYYKNRDFTRIFEEIQGKIKQTDYEKWNKRFVRYEGGSKWGWDENKENSVNCYEGIEISKTISFSINDSSQWTIGDKITTYHINFEYDVKKNPNVCRLEIIQFISTEEERRYYDVSKSYNPFRRDVYESYGTFSELTKEVKDFLHENLKQHGITL